MHYVYVSVVAGKRTLFDLLADPSSSDCCSSRALMLIEAVHPGLTKFRSLRYGPGRISRSRRCRSIPSSVLLALHLPFLQPYIDLVRGDAPPEKSLLLDYTRTNNFVVWIEAAHNGHWVVTAASIMVLVTLYFQPLASSLLSVRNTWILLPGARNCCLTAPPLKILTIRLQMSLSTLFPPSH
jgi:hypothetical protein